MIRIHAVAVAEDKRSQNGTCRLHVKSRNRSNPRERGGSLRKVLREGIFRSAVRARRERASEVCRCNASSGCGLHPARLELGGLEPIAASQLRSRARF